MPESVHFFMSSSNRFAVIAIIGTVFASVLSRARMRQASSGPSVTGIVISVSITSIAPGFESVNAFSASAPFAVPCTFAPASVSIYPTISILSSLSSATRIFSPSSDSAGVGVSAFCSVSSPEEYLYNSVISKRVPLPFSLCTSIVPFCPSTSFLTMASPRPTPSKRPFAACPSRANGSNIFSWNSLLMPIP